MASNETGDLLGSRDGSLDIPDQTNIAQPYSQNEIEDLLYRSDLPVEERLAQLRQMREDAAVRESGDWGDEDPVAAMDEIDRAIEELSGDSADSDENFEMANVVIDDPANHSHALSPDDVDALEELSGISEDGEEIESDDEDDVDLGDERMADRDEVRSDLH
ncbi:hypothetical protein VW35_12400 [Devosia soli]|uniref:Uncharacterized protein n=1 Tax=Devosia soli TaxID=361041 RepID=A0A0F5L6V0_9HYPH|nr:hypothetical protein [Devosia soli]KKB77939.1 hypothetical protein VW35_12400 [Devosia soli]